MKVKTSIADHHADAGGHREPEHGGGGGGGDEVLQYSFEVTSLASYGQMVYKKCKKNCVCRLAMCLQRFGRIITYNVSWMSFFRFRSQYFGPEIVYMNVSS